MAIQLRVIKNQKGTTLQEWIIQGHWQHWTIKTPDKDENERIKRRYQTSSLKIERLQSQVQLLEQ